MSRQVGSRRPRVKRRREVAARARFLWAFHVLEGEAVLIGLFSATMRTVAPSRTRKTARVIVELSAKDVGRPCWRPYFRSEQTWGQFDADQGILVASTCSRWRGDGEILFIRIAPRDASVCEVSLESDAVSPYLVWDILGTNTRNIRRLINALVIERARMEDKGFVESEPEVQGPEATGLPRRMYRATGEGAQVLKAYERAAKALLGVRVAT